jgi:hypothetical protein
MKIVSSGENTQELANDALNHEIKTLRSKIAELERREIS